MADLKTSVTDTDIGKLWVVAGKDGAVSLELMRPEESYFGPIVIHHPRPIYKGQRPERCNVLEGPCYTDAAYRAGQSLGESWGSNGRNDLVMWMELTQWYRAHLTD